MLEIFLLEQLVAFSKNGTLSGAAKELHISQPALSRSMKKIENEFGVPLFDRSKSKIALNETGKIAAKYAKKVLEADWEMFDKTIAFERSQRTISFGSCASLPANKLMTIIQEFVSTLYWQLTYQFFYNTLFCFIFTRMLLQTPFSKLSGLHRA